MGADAPPRHLFGPPLWLILPAALLVRLVGLQSRPIWYDEAFAVLFARAGPAAMVYGTLAPDASGSASDIHPLGYYTLLWGWMEVLGQNIPVVRLLSVLTGLSAVWLGYRLLLRLSGPAAAGWGGLFLALSPFQVHYSQEVRMYALLAFLLLAAAYFHWQAMGLLDSDAPRGTRYWVLFAIAAAAAQYTHNLAVFFLLPLAALPLLLGRWSAARKTLLAGLGALLLYSPWLVQLPGQVSKVSTAYWTSPPDASRLATTLLAFVTNLPVPDSALPFALLAAVLLPAWAAWQTLSAVRRGRSAAFPGLLLACLAFLPPALMFLVSQWVPVYIERALLPSGIFFLLWLAWSTFAVPMPSPVRLASASLLLAAMAVGLYSHLTYAGFPYAPYAALNDSFLAGSGDGMVIVHASKLSALPAYLDDPGLPHRYLADIPGSGSDTLARPTQEVIGFLADGSIEQAVVGAELILFVVFEQELDEYAALGAAAHPALAWLETHFDFVGVQPWGDLAVYEFRSP